MRSLRAADRGLFRSRICEEPRRGAAQFLQFLLLFITEMAEALGVGVHPGLEAVASVCIKQHIIMSARRVQEREQGTSPGDPVARDRKPAPVSLPHLVLEAGFAEGNQQVVGLRWTEVKLRRDRVGGLWVVATNAL